MIEVDGAFGEGGGQILRSALSLSLVTGRPFRIEHIRQGRRKPGLRHQHLAAVRAAAEISGAEIRGDRLGSIALSFKPGSIRPGRYAFDVGTAGSVILVLQTLLPALWCAGGPSEIAIEGGTHNPFAPPFEFLEHAYLPMIRRIGPQVQAALERYGFFPSGGGRIRMKVERAGGLGRLEVPVRGKLLDCRALALLARLPRHIAERELRVVRDRLGWPEDNLAIVDVGDDTGPGNVLALVMRSEHATEVVTGFGRRGLSAENVAVHAVEAARRYLSSQAPVGRYLADQLLLPMALSGAGAYRTLEPSPHTITNIEVIRQFLEIDIIADRVNDSCWEIRFGRTAENAGPPKGNG
ncbi:MAG: RNA 3'-terminal phosphate cyclase [Desulfobacterales bacterium]